MIVGKLLRQLVLVGYDLADIGLDAYLAQY